MNLLITLILIILLGAIIYLSTLLYKDSQDKFYKALRNLGLKHVMQNASYKQARSLEDNIKQRIIAVLRCALEYNLSLSLDEAIAVAKNESVQNIELFIYSYYIINQVDPNFSIGKLSQIAVFTPDIEAFARSWADQINANLNISYETALKYVHQKKDFCQLVSLDIMAKNEGLDIEERPLINEVDEEGLKLIIYSMIKANNAGIFLDDESSYRVNKVQNINEYKEAFKITTTLLKNLHKNYGRDVTRFTNSMVRAHNEQLWMNFSESDLYNLTDDDFDNLVSNLIKAKKNGIVIDPKDLILHNVSGDQMNNLIASLIKAKYFGLDLKFNELMKYYNLTGSDPMKFVKALYFSIKYNVKFTKEDLEEYSKPNADIYDLVKGVKDALDLQAEAQSEDGKYGINQKSVRKHFLEFGIVTPAINAVKKCQEVGLKMSFKLAGQILRSEKYTLESAKSWAQNPQVVEVEKCLTTICKSGVQITPKINITVRGKMELIFIGYGLDILNKRINEAVVSMFESFDSHEYILKNLPDISNKVLKMINEEESMREIKTNPDNATETQLNQYCAYQLLDVNIYDIIIGENVKTELELRQAEIESRKRILQAEADRAKAEADIRIAMVQQYVDGTKPNFNELHKANLLSEKNKSIETGYEKLE
ncbi:MAG: flotillin-like FloA family protein [Bacteroidales bacterium]|nr:flotillin-like FloA family protein [Bacteroidales bacterium]